MLPVLNGTYHVRVQGGKAEAKKLPEGKAKASAQLNARTLAQLYGGYFSPQQAAELGLIETPSEADLAGMQAVLSPPGQPKPYMADDF